MILLDAIERHLAETASTIRDHVPPPRTEERPSLTVIDTPVIDSTVLADLYRVSLDPSFVERLLWAFRADTERLVRTISDSLAARRYEAAKDAAHALKGGAGSVGASQLVQLAIRFEKASYETLRVRASPWMEELARASTTALTAFDQHLEERRKQQSSDG
jgi:two-component system sensor histidine kinase RpfC